METVSSSSTNARVIAQYKQGLQTREEYESAFRESSVVSKAASVDRMVPLPPATVQELGLDRQRRPWASFSPPEGFSVGARGLFQTFLSNTLGSTPHLEEQLERVQETPIRKRSKAGVTEEQKGMMTKGLERLVDASSLHEEVRIQSIEFVQG